MGSEVVSAAATEVSSGDLFDRGWIGEPAQTEATSVAETQAQTEASSAATAATSETSSQQTTVGSEASSSASSTVAASATQSSVDYEQRWKSLDGIVRKNNATISALQSQLEARDRAAQSQAASATKSEPVDLEAAIDALETKYTDALREGASQTDLNKIRREIRVLERQVAQAGLVSTKDLEQTVSNKAAEVVAAKNEDEAINQIAVKAYEQYPFLDINGAEPNHNAIRFVKATTADYVNGGMARPEALAQAIKDVIPYFTSAATSVVSQPAKPIDEAKLKEMAPVSKKASPVIANQRPEGKGTFDAGWERPIAN